MILTYKVRHERDFSSELAKARKIAEHAVKTRTITSRDVKHIGLKSAIANQILRKYSRNRTTKRVRSVKLTVPAQSIKADHETHTITVPCLKLSLTYQFPGFTKVNQMELDESYAYISVTAAEKAETPSTGYIGVDLNTTGHAAVAADPETGKVWKLGKQAHHVHNKYRNLRRQLQKQGKYGMVKKLKDRESRIVRDMNHKISRKIVETAADSKAGVKMERLDKVRENRKHARSFNYALNSWSYRQLQTMIQYKAKLRGVEVVRVEPAYTSQRCSRCGLLGYRNGKRFKCPSCGHVEDADANASFNIALAPPSMAGVPRSSVDRDALEGSTDTPHTATRRTTATAEPHDFSRGSMSGQATGMSLISCFWA